MIFEVKCDELTYLLTYEELTDRTHTRIVSFIVLDKPAFISLGRSGKGEDRQRIVNKRSLKAFTLLPFA